MAEKRGPGRPAKHGTYSKALLAPLTEAHTTAIMEVMSGEHMMIAPQDRFMIGMLARTFAQLELMDKWLQDNGLFQNDTKNTKGLPQPILQHYWHAIKIASKLCSDLGLTPDARVRLGVGVAKVQDLASRIKGVQEVP